MGSKFSDNTENLEKKSQRDNWRITRRGFLLGVGVAGAGTVLTLRYGIPSSRLGIAKIFEKGTGPPVAVPESPLSWFEITSENDVYFFIPKVEMGQGIHTALAQIVAEELEIAWEQMKVVPIGTSEKFPNSLTLTSASNSVSALYTPLRNAAATVREMLREAAAKQLSVPLTSVVVKKGSITTLNDSSLNLSYGEIVQNTSNWLEPTAKPRLKKSSLFNFIGKPIKRIDLLEKINGTAIYGYDARLPGMLFGAVARPDRLGAVLIGAQSGNAINMPGVVSVVIKDGFAGIVAKSRSQAYSALRQLELQWSTGKELDSIDVEDMVTVGKGEGQIIEHSGRPISKLARGNVYQAEFRTPPAVHGQLEPQAALVTVKKNKVEIWVSTQNAGGVQSAVAKALNIDSNSIKVNATYVGGGFGLKSDTRVAVEAAILSQSVGEPVHLGWNRREEMMNGRCRPPTHHVLRGRLGLDGQIIAMEHQQASGDVLLKQFPEFLHSVFGVDVIGAARRAQIHYLVKNKQTTAWWIHDLPLQTWSWPGLGLLANVFAIESFIDELARKAKRDPLQFRLEHLGSDGRSVRLQKVLNAVAVKSGWGKSLPEGHALGIACCVDVNTVVAEVAEVSVNKVNNEIVVHRVTVAIDPGFVVNPAGAKAQVEFGVILGLSSTLIEELKIIDGRVDAENFDKYPLLDMSKAPRIDVVFLQSGKEPFGIGEPPIGPIAAAVNNAVSTLTGQRLRKLPLKIV